ncbi:hypothetical protein [Nannocystis pusilla]|uniref:hypothetical protein n=1 Tax=Nannocystis pusilla TaxID=889268 RepID=UPI003B7A550E
MPTSKLRRLTIAQFRDVEPGTELRFVDGIHLVVGDRHAGKTTLLTLLSMVCRGSFMLEHGDEPFDLEAELQIRGRIVLMRRARVRDSGRWVERFELVTDPPQAERPPFLSGWVWCSGEQFGGECPDLEFDMHYAFRFDDGLAAFAAATGDPLGVSGPAVPRLARAHKQALDPGACYDYLPRALGDLFAADRPTDPVFQRPLAASELDLGRSLAGALDARDVTTAANFHDFEFGGDLCYDVRGFTFAITRRDGRVVAHADLAFGEQRLLGFFYYLACNLAVVFADELPTGLSEPQLAACLAALRDRQVFLACSDPARLLQHLAPARWIDCTHRHGRLRWRDAPGGVHRDAALPDLSPVRGSP